ncbi:hypothetical protein [Calothrix sp. NIES-3974]|nr:hypothetical protein [Calothrix sp. NIES-3974]
MTSQFVKGVLLDLIDGLGVSCLGDLGWVGVCDRSIWVGLVDQNP